MNAIKILEAWNSRIKNKSEYPLGHLSHKDCEIEYFGRPKIQSKEELLIWFTDNTTAKCIGDFHVIYEKNGVCCGNHGLAYSSGKFGLIMFFGQYSDMGVTSCNSLVSRDRD